VRVRSVFCALALLVPALARGQGVISPVEHLAFDRPESWALQYFTSASLLTGLDDERGDPAGSIAVGVEAGWIPSLSADQERVGFGGTAGEDLNKAPIFFRPRVRVALPHRLVVTGGGVPPIHAFGVTPRLATVALDWTMTEANGWRLGWRGHAQTGTVTGAFTCPQSVLAFAPGSIDNPTGCVAESSDKVTLRYAAVEFHVSRRLAALPRITPHVAVGVSRISSHFQVNAATFDYLDHTRLDMSGVAWSVSPGAAMVVSPRINVVVDLFYSPLKVARIVGATSTIDGLLNVRGLVSYRLR
jgi:hypothetical protein